MRHFLSFLILLMAAWAVFADDAFPLTRRDSLPNNLWTNAGIPGGIPAVTTIYTNLSDGASLSAIQTAVKNCPSNQVVKLGAGTYNLGAGTLYLTNNGVVVRGSTNAQGWPTTFVTNGLLRTSTFFIPGGSGGFPDCTARTISSGLAKGSTSVTLSTTPGSAFGVGRIFAIDQITNSLIKRSSNCDIVIRCPRPWSQVVLCTNVDGNTLHFWPPLIGTNWDVNASPEALGWANQGNQNTAKRVGLEDIDFIEVHETGQGLDQYTFYWADAYECWVKNLKIKPQTVGAVIMHATVNCEIRDSYFYDGMSTVGRVYSLLTAWSSLCRIENNTFTNCSGPLPIASAQGCSISFNLGLPPYPVPYNFPNDTNVFFEWVFYHDGHGHDNIMEGNWFDAPFFADDVFGKNSSHASIVRSRMIGWYPGKDEQARPIQLGTDDPTDVDHFAYTILGNVLGAPEFHTSTNDFYGTAAIDACTGYIATNNFDTVTKAIPANQALGGNTMLDSYVYAGAPQWWGNRQWPFITPISTATNSWYRTNFPAGYRAEFGEWPAGAAGGGGPPEPAVRSVANGQVIFGGQIYLRQ